MTTPSFPFDYKFSNIALYSCKNTIYDPLILIVFYIMHKMAIFKIDTRFLDHVKYILE